MILDLQMQSLFRLVKMYGFDIRYQEKVTDARPIVGEFKVDGVVPNDINGYELVLTNKLISIGSDGQRHFDVI